MKPQIEKLITALRSGQYKQDTGMLYDAATNCYCVLGVAGEVLCPDAMEDYKGAGAWGYNIYHRIYDALGITGESGDKLVCLNDIKCMTFNEIADWLEVHHESIV